MELINRIEAFIKLGDYIQENPEELQSVVRLASIKNPWFTKEFCYQALTSIHSKMLQKNALEEWLKNYKLDEYESQKIGVIAAGNIPLVSFHDILCILISGHKLFIKFSDKDAVLTPFLLQLLIKRNPEWENFIFTDQKWNEIDAVIATGSNNSSRYFEYYFGSKPHIIRKNRHSLAVLTGNETEIELEKLGKDVFDYFGLGCRNVSLIWLPKDYNFEPLLYAWRSFSELMYLNAYKNNLDYQRTIYLMNGTPIVDCDFVNLIDQKSLNSPISCVHLAYYENTSEISDWLARNENSIQCVVNFKEFPRNVPFGTSQEPELNEYADGIDTMKFLTNL